MGISVKRGARIVRVGAVKESVGKGADTAEMVEGGQKEKHILATVCSLLSIEKRSCSQRRGRAVNH
jgi:hypothetical protein